MCFSTFIEVCVSWRNSWIGVTPCWRSFFESMMSLKVSSVSVSVSCELPVIVQRRAMEKVHLSTCESCGHEVNHLDPTELPVEPLYDMRIAAYLIPMRYEALRKWLYRNKEHFQARYRLHGHSHRRIRLLSASEIRLIRKLCLRGNWQDSPQVAERFVKAHAEVPPFAEPACVMEGAALMDTPMTPEETADLLRDLGPDEEDLQAPETPQAREEATQP